MDHLQSERIEIVPFYLDEKKRAYEISPAQLYSNTPSDFDFKLAQSSKSLSNQKFKEALRATDIVFPTMHGPYGEDGGIQRALERSNIPYVGSSSTACNLIFDKFDSNKFIREHGFFAPASAVLKIYHKDHKQIIDRFFKEHKIKRAVVKPANGGSSIGVFSVTTPQEALAKAELLFSKRMDTRVVIEPFAQGIEFTAIILQNKFGLPVCVLPTEIETDYTENQIFDFRKKYLPTRQVTWHCPPRFSNDVIERIQVQAEQLFQLFGMADFARFDGWVMDSGDIWFSDFNPISGMEQNSFLFQQASRIGMSHSDVLRYIVRNACHRQGIEFPSFKFLVSSFPKKNVHVLFGGNNAERQVSLMSGTNAWLKLRQSKKYDPKPFFLDLDNKTVYSLPYALALSHTAEEMSENCRSAQAGEKRLHNLVEKVKLRLALKKEEVSEPFFLPKKYTLTDFIKQAPFVFIGLHGGMGESGTIQAMLESARKPFNGSGADTSAICIDKQKTTLQIEKYNIKNVSVIPELAVQSATLAKLSNTKNEKKLQLLWNETCVTLKTRSLIAKPADDGCSAGVAHLYSAQDLATYARLITSKATQIPSNTFKNQVQEIELPSETPKTILLQQYIATDSLRVKANRLKYTRRSGWLEITVGLLNGNALNPSITIAEGEVLSVEEKFQGGTGVNLTPPPVSVLPPELLLKIKAASTEISKKLNLKGYGRIDAFANCKTGELKIIEVNTLPALTPSTVLFHQALSEPKPIYPVELLEMIIQSSNY